MNHITLNMLVKPLQSSKACIIIADNLQSKSKMNLVNSEQSKSNSFKQTNQTQLKFKNV